MVVTSQRVGLLHISDFHLSSNRKPEQTQILEQVAVTVWNLACHPKKKELSFCAILITGDLADTCREHDLAEVKRFLRLPPGPTNTPWLCCGYPTLRGADKPCCAIPGDHDRRVDGVPGNSGIYDVLADAQAYEKWANDVCLRYLPTHAAAHLAIVCADFTLEDLGDVPGGSGDFRQGLVYDNRYEALSQLTQEAQKEGLPVIWMMHFPPNSMVDDPARRLIGGDRLLALARSLGVPRILCGHIHRLRSEDISGEALTVDCAGSACLREGGEPPSIRFLELLVNGPSIVGVEKTRVWRWSEHRSVFQEVHPPHTGDRYRPFRYPAVQEYGKYLEYLKTLRR